MNGGFAAFGADPVGALPPHPRSIFEAKMEAGS